MNCFMNNYIVDKFFTESIKCLQSKISLKTQDNMKSSIVAYIWQIQCMVYCSLLLQWNMVQHKQQQVHPDKCLKSTYTNLMELT